MIADPLISQEAILGEHSGRSKGKTMAHIGQIKCTLTLKTLKS